MTTSVLVGDIGGTNARFGLSHRPGEISDITSFKVAEFATCEAAIAAYLASLPETSLRGRSIVRAAVAAAGPIDEAGAITLTNASWHLDPNRIAGSIAGAPVRLFNDLEAVALALPHLTANEYRSLGTAPAAPLSGNLLALNVGTGLGAAAAINANGRWSAIATEAGHMTFAARTRRESALIDAAISYEDLLSGPGLRHLAGLLTPTQAKRDRSEASAAPERIATPIDRGTWHVFTEILARLAGDLVLATGTWGGVYLTGSVAVSWSAAADINAFRQVFAAKGKMHARMQRVPLRLITAAEPALFGLSHTDCHPEPSASQRTT